MWRSRKWKGALPVTLDGKDGRLSEEPGYGRRSPWSRRQEGAALPAGMLLASLLLNVAGGPVARETPPCVPGRTDTQEWKIRLWGLVSDSGL